MELLPAPSTRCSEIVETNATSNAATGILLHSTLALVQGTVSKQKPSQGYGSSRCCCGAIHGLQENALLQNACDTGKGLILPVFAPARPANTCLIIINLRCLRNQLAMTRSLLHVVVVTRRNGTACVVGKAFGTTGLAQIPAMHNVPNGGHCCRGEEPARSGFGWA